MKALLNCIRARIGGHGGGCPGAKPAIDLRGLDAGQDRIRPA